MTTLLIVTLALVLVAEFVNGWTDAPNAIATVVSTHVLSPRVAVPLAVVLNTLGAMSGTAVAATVGKGIVNPDVVTLPAICAAMGSIIIWGSFAARVGLPVSKSHALLAGIAGAGIAGGGFDALISSGWKLVAIGMFSSICLGMLGSFLLSKTIIVVARNQRPTSTKRCFDYLQIISASAMAFSHGMNDGQKFMGVFVLALVLGGTMEVFTVSWPVIIVCALTMGLGTSLGGWRIIKTIGMKMVRIASWQGFAAEAAASLTIIGASAFGIPLSTTHTITSSIVGSAASRRVRDVKWGVLGRIIFAWVFTFPFCGLFAFFAARATQLW